MASIADVIKFTPTLGGLTDWILATAATGYRTPSGNLTNGTTYSYRAQSSDNSEWEVGTGAWTSATSTLARTTVLYSSTGSKVNFTVAPQVAIVALTADMLKADSNLSDVASAATARTNLGVGTGDSPQFTGINIGHATDTTITRTGAGDIAVEGNAVYRAGGTDVAVADGGTGASTLAANNVLLGNGTSALQTVAPSTSGNVLTSNGTTWTSAAPAASGGKAADYQAFTSSGTWTKPSGYSAEAIALIQGWGGGGGAGRGSVANQAGGGGGGGYSERWILLSALGSTETVTIGAGGAGRTGSTGTGTAGGNTTFGSLVTAYGGGAGGQGAPGGGGSDSGAGASAISSIPMVMAADATPAITKYSPVQPPHPHFGGTGKHASYSSYYTAANAVFGGGGGGGNGQTGGTSQNGGAGGNSAATPTAGTQPGGGGGASSSANVDGADGAAGKCIVTVFDGA